jgi:hypothetical protein
MWIVIEFVIGAIVQAFLLPFRIAYGIAKLRRNRRSVSAMGGFSSARQQNSHRGSLGPALPSSGECVVVEKVYQRAHRGTKAIVRLPSGQRQDTWFEGRRVEKGWHLRIPASNVGYGPHSGRTDVRYVPPDGVYREH